MPSDARPEPEPLPGPGGEPCATFLREERDGLPIADYIEPVPGTDLAIVVAAALAELPGWLAGTADMALGEALVAAGATRRRHAHSLSLHLPTAPAAPLVSIPLGVVIEPVGVLAPELAEVNAAAYPVGHPDHVMFVEGASIHELAAGGVVGPMLPCSRVAVRDGLQVGVSLVTDSGGRPPRGGPWLVELFRLPGDALRGLGAALLAATLDAARSDGLRTIGLAVSDGNPARELYEAFGFALQDSAMTVRLPG